MEECTWTQDDDGNWETACGNTFVITAGTPSENDMRFCCYCGREIAEDEFFPDGAWVDEELEQR